MNPDDKILTASEALKMALLSAIDDEDASDAEVSEFIDTAFDDYNEHVGKLLDSAADGAAEAKARQRRKDKLEAERRAAMQRGETTKRKETEMDRMLTIAKAVASGSPTTVTKAQFFDEMSERAEAEKKPGESVAQAFARFAETDIGKVLMQAHKLAGGPDHQFERPEVTKADTPPMPALDKLKAMAADHQKTTGVTPEAAFAAVYTDPANRDLVAQHKVELAEQSSIDAAGKWPGVAQTFRPAGAPEHTARVS